MKWLSIVVFVFLLLVGFATYAQDTVELSASITDASGNELGTVSFSVITDEMVRDMDFPEGSLEGAVAIWVQVQGLTPGFHGFHIHGVGTCDPSGERAFVSAGRHLHSEGQVHGQHTGDLPSLLVSESGVAVLVLASDRFTFDDLMDEDGSAVIIHTGGDNFGNIPADRYDPDADETTLNTGDAGGRAGCGIIQPT